MQRYDVMTFRAEKTAEGFIRDAPIVGRAGLLKYINADGSSRIEYRPAEEAFAEDSLASLQGKPITLGHKAMVTARNAAAIAPIGTVLTAGRQDGGNIRADIVIYDLPTSARELSCGYTLDLDETPGTTPDGEHYDAVQRHVRYNHVAVVPKGRAGVSRLNMDGDQLCTEEEKRPMAKVRLDTGIEYEVPAEVEAAMKKMNQDAADMKKASDQKQAKLDTLQAKYDSLKSEADKKESEWKAKFDGALKERVALMDAAKTYGVENADSMTSLEIKKAVIAKTSKVNLDGKSEDYIEAAYDMAIADGARRADGITKQKQAMKKPAANPAGNNQDTDDVDTAMAKLRKDEADAWMKEVK